MKFSVNGVKSFIGTEGHGFNANLLADGKKVAFVIDSANGGCYDWHWVNPKDTVIPAELKKQAIEYAGDGFEVEDSFISMLVQDVQMMNDLKRRSKTSVLFVTNENKNELEYFQKKTTNHAATTSQLAIKYKDKGIVFLNPLIESKNVDEIKKVLKVKTAKDYAAEFDAQMKAAQ